MKNNCRFAIAASLLLSISASHGATIVYDSVYSVGESNAIDFTNYGSAGYILDATAPVGGSYVGTGYTSVNPFTSTGYGNGYATESDLSSAFTATSVGQNYVEARGHSYGTAPGGVFDYIGLAGTQGTTPTDEFSLTFNSASSAGYRIAIPVQSNANGNGANSITLYTGPSLGTATSQATNPTVINGDLVFYSFDVSNISAGDTVTLHLANAQTSGNLLYAGFTLDALTVVPEPSTFWLLGLGGLGLLAINRRRFSPSK